jgi:Secreted repeat of unknown function
MGIFPKHAWLMVLGLVLGMAASRCGGTTTSGSTPTTATSTPTTAPTPIPTTASSFTVQIAQATVIGKTITILTSAQGLTLYSFTPDTVSKTVCTGSCAQIWPPLLFTGTGKPTAFPALPGA